MLSSAAADTFAARATAEAADPADAGGGLPGWVWIALGGTAVFIAGAVAVFLAGRRRRT